MKLVKTTFLLSFITSASVFADSLPNGNYAGKLMLLKNDGSFKQISQAVIIHSNNMQVLTTVDNHSSVTHAYSINIGKYGFFDLYDKDENTGFGYCVLSNCYYTIYENNHYTHLRFYTDKQGLKHLAKEASWTDAEGVQYRVFGDLMGMG